MELLVLYPLAFVGSVVWVVSAEALAAGYGAAGHHPLIVGALATGGQNTAYVLIFFGGGGLAKRWQWLDEKARGLEARWGERLDRSYRSLMACGALLGIPPLLAMVTLASTFRVGLRTTLAITLTLRMVRFTLLAMLGETAVAWFA